MQIYDTGLLESPCGTLEVREVQVYAGYVLHIGSMTTSSGKLSIGNKVSSKVRASSRLDHSGLGEQRRSIDFDFWHMMRHVNDFEYSKSQSLDMVIEVVEAPNKNKKGIIPKFRNCLTVTSLLPSSVREVKETKAGSNGTEPCDMRLVPECFSLIRMALCPPYCWLL